MNGDVVVAVVAVVLVIETDCMHQLVDGKAHKDAAIDLKRQVLLASDFAYA